MLLFNAHYSSSVLWKENNGNKNKKNHSRTRYYIKLLLEIFNKKQEKSQVALHKNKLTVDLFLFQSAFGQRNH